MVLLATVVRRLSSLVDLDREALTRLQRLEFATAQVNRGQVISRAQAESRTITWLCSGFAAQGYIREDQTHVPTTIVTTGDICDFSFLATLPQQRHVVTLTPARIVRCSKSQFLSLAQEDPVYMQALLRGWSRQQALDQAHLMRLSALDAAARMAHFVCELARRLDEVGLLQSDRFDFPVTQNDLAELLSLSAVHLNRVLQRLRHQQLLRFEHGELTVLNRDTLAELGCFDGGYMATREAA